MSRNYDFYGGYEDETAFSPQLEENALLHHTPWWAISVAFHALILLAIWTITISKVEAEDKSNISANIENLDLLEPPKIIPPDILEQERLDPIEETIEELIIEETKDENEVMNENPDELRPTQEEPSPVKSPYPQKGFNASIGLGGNIGGGDGPGGPGSGFKQRDKERKNSKTEQNVMAALYWLRDHQHDNGLWSSDGFHNQCGRPSSIGKVRFKREGRCSNKDGSDDKGWRMGTEGVTGLSILAFLGAGYTQDEGEFQLTVKKGLRYLLGIQTDDGCFGSKEDQHYIYNHAICTMAIAEAYAMTGASTLKGPAQRAVKFIADAQNEDPERGYLGWRYGVKTGESDASVTGWMILALKSAKAADLEIPERCWDGALRLYDDLTGDVNGYPRTGYLTKGGPNARLREASQFLPNPSMDAINILSQLFMDKPRTTSTLVRQANLITQDNNLPTTEDPDKIDYYYWYYASLAIFQMGGVHWKKWEEPMIKALTNTQRLEDKDACVYGSWDAIDAWSMPGGRVYSTAINTLTLEVYYRYEFLGTTSK